MENFMKNKSSQNFPCVLVAIDSFKGSLSSLEAAEAVKLGITRVFPSATVTLRPIADGGEGTARAIAYLDGQARVARVKGPLGEATDAEYYLTENGERAVIEMATAAGLTLLRDGQRNPMKTTTYGVGELMRRAIEVDGCKKLTVCIGGSATNDGGVGMLMALGYRFLDKDGCDIGFGAEALAKLSKIERGNLPSSLSDVEITVACDVDNPLCGERGASAVYGPQKGATPEEVILMDSYLQRFADLSKKLLGTDLSRHTGAGAAGGLGYALMEYLGAKLIPGIELVAGAVELEKCIEKADIVVTGEGKLDMQSAMGKAPVGVAKMAKKYSKTVIAFSGAVGKGAGACNENGIDAFFPITRYPTSLGEAMDKANASKNLTDTAEQVFRLISAAKGE